MFTSWENFLATVNRAGFAWKDLLGQANGSSTNDSAKAGSVGEIVSSTIASGSAVGLTTGTPANVTSIALTKGDWDVSLTACFTGNGATTVTYIAGSISTTSATIDATPGNRGLINYNGATVLGTECDLPIGPVRLSLAANTTVYLVVQAGFGVNTCSAFGNIRARRMR